MWYVRMTFGYAGLFAVTLLASCKHTTNVQRISSTQGMALSLPPQTLQATECNELNFSSVESFSTDLHLNVSFYPDAVSTAASLHLKPDCSDTAVTAFTYHSQSLSMSDTSSSTGETLFLKSPKSGQVQFVLNERNDRVAQSKFSVAVGAGPAGSIEVSSGDQQSAQVASDLVAPLVLKVLDANKNPVAGETVNFSIEPVANSTSGALTVATGVSAANGTVSTQLTLGTKSGAWHVNAIAASLGASKKIIFDATAKAGPVAAATIVGQSSLPEQLCTRGLYYLALTDIYGNESTSTHSVTLNPQAGSGAKITWHSSAACGGGDVVSSIAVAAGDSRSAGLHLLVTSAGTDTVAVAGDFSTPAPITFTLGARQSEHFDSYQMAIDTVQPRGFIASQAGNANFDFYYTAAADLSLLELPLHYNAGAHWDAFNHIQGFWYDYSGTVAFTSGYGYFGKSTVGRGLDIDEANTPSPSGADIFDFQIHAPSTGDAVRGVAKFKAPYTGSYSLSGIAARRPESACGGGTSIVNVYDASTTLVTSVTANPNRIWANDAGGGDYTFSLNQDDSIYFVTGVGTSAWDCDATELAFNIVAPAPAMVTVFAANPYEPAVNIGSTASVRVALTAPPSKDVRVKLQATGTAATEISATTLTFTPTNWDIPQSTQLSGQNNSGASTTGTAHITVQSITSEDPEFDGLTSAGSADFQVQYRP